jgi:hypothetical protein
MLNCRWSTSATGGRRYFSFVGCVLDAACSVSRSSLIRCVEDAPYVSFSYPVRRGRTLRFFLLSGASRTHPTFLSLIRCVEDAPYVSFSYPVRRGRTLRFWCSRPVAYRASDPTIVISPSEKPCPMPPGPAKSAAARRRPSSPRRCPSTRCPSPGRRSSMPGRSFPAGRPS